MSEHLVVVVFDVEAESREAAHKAFTNVMDFRRNAVSPDMARMLIHHAFSTAGIESWWFPEPDVKHIDGNDCDAMILVPEDWLTTRGGDD